METKSKEETDSKKMWSRNGSQRGHEPWPEDLQELVTYKWGGGGRKRSLEKVLMEEDVDHTLDERERRPPNPQELGKWLTTLGPSVSNSRENCLCMLDPFSFLGFKEQRHGAVFIFESQREAWMRPPVLSSNWAAKVQGSWVAASLPKMNWQGTIILGKEHHPGIGGIRL